MIAEYKVILPWHGRERNKEGFINMIIRQGSTLNERLDYVFKKIPMVIRGVQLRLPH
jgi:hypothetical protein